MQLFRLCLPDVIRAKVYLVLDSYYSFISICFKIMEELIC